MARPWICLWVVRYIIRLRRVARHRRAANHHHFSLCHNFLEEGAFGPPMAWVGRQDWNKFWEDYHYFASCRPAGYFRDRWEELVSDTEADDGHWVSSPVIRPWLS